MAVRGQQDSKNGHQTNPKGQSSAVNQFFGSATRPPRELTEEEKEERANLFKTDLQIQLDQSKKRIAALLTSIDENNQELQQEVEDTQEEFFNLENKKKRIEDGLYVPCEDALDLLGQLDEIDTNFQPQQSLEDEPDFFMDFEADRVKKKQTQKKLKTKDVLDRLKKYVKEQQEKQAQLDAKISRMYESLN